MSRFSFSLTAAAAPQSAIEITSGRVVGVSLDDRGGRPVVAAHATELLPDAALTPALNTLNVHDRPAVVRAIGRVLDQIGRPRRIGLIVGDPVAKVSLIRLQQVPGRVQDLEQVIRWQVRKGAPFAIEDAQVSFEAGLRTDEGQEFVVTLARRDVVSEYESVCAEAGAQAGIVDLSTFNVVNAVLAGGVIPDGDWLLVNVAPGWESIAIMRGRQLIFFRSRGADGEGTLADLVHQTAMYYEDRLSGARFTRVLLCGASSAGDADGLRRALAERLSTAVESVDPARAAGFTDRISAAGALLDTLTPLVGLILRNREAA
ncbi:MAG TPA: pilus assembly protein PilM [Vicinamibacterales bacterium]|nr:pilus assembly protein PilM [Vicinamibacterales bacterium]